VDSYDSRIGASSCLEPSGSRKEGNLLARYEEGFCYNEITICRHECDFGHNSCEIRGDKMIDKEKKIWFYR
jgi:hypothetical protein